MKSNKTLVAIIITVLILLVSSPAFALTITSDTPNQISLYNSNNELVIDASITSGSVNDWQSARNNIGFGYYENINNVVIVNAQNVKYSTIVFPLPSKAVDATIYNFNGYWTALPTTISKGFAQAPVNNLGVFALVVESYYPYYNNPYYPNYTKNVTIQDCYGNPTGGWSIVSSQTTDTTSKILGLNDNQSLIVYSIGNLDGKAPYVVTFPINTSAANTEAYYLGNDGTWTKMYINKNNGYASVMISSPAVIGVVTTKQATPTYNENSIILPVGTEYYLIKYENNVAYMVGNKMTLKYATVVQNQFTYGNGQIQFTMGGITYVTATNVTPVVLNTVYAPVAVNTQPAVASATTTSTQTTNTSNTNADPYGGIFG